MINNEAEIRIATSNEMASASEIIVYAVRPDNKEIVASSAIFKVAGLFKNNVILNADRKKFAEIHFIHRCRLVWILR